MIDLSIIIVNYKTRELLKKLLSSLRINISNSLTHEVFVVDNDSCDGSVEMVSKEFPDIQLIESKENLGFSKANNVAIKRATGEIVLLLNPDTLMIPDNEFDKIIQRFRSDEQIGIIGGSVFDVNLKQVSSFGHDPTPLTLILHFTLIGKVLARLFPIIRKFRLANYNKSSFMREQEVDHINGCCFFIRRKMLEQIGMLDERYFMFLEETDYCLNARKANWKVKYIPLKTVIHFGQESTRQNRNEMSEQFLKSLKLFYEKHYPSDMKKLEWILRLKIIKPRIKKNIKS